MVCQTIVDLVSLNAETNSRKKAFTFLVNGEVEGVNVTFSQLFVRAKAIGSVLQRHVRVGERALILLPQSMAYLEAFFGCQFAGVVAIPAYPPRKNYNLLRLQSILSDAQPTAIFTLQDIKQDIVQRLDCVLLQNVIWLFPDQIPDSESENWVFPDVNVKSVSYLQYTSGSTGRPKGVIITHENLLENLRSLDQDIKHDYRDSIVSWLPLFHDLGLIYGGLQPIYSGISCYLMAPVSFLQKPVRWLQAISKYKATCTAAPTFAYAFCIEKIRDEQCSTIDLSSLKMAMIGAERVRFSVIKKFSERFSIYGFSEQMFSPAYGQAECTLKVTMIGATETLKYLNVDKQFLSRNIVATTEAPFDDENTLVSSGILRSHTEVLIVDAKTKKECSPMMVGEIWVKGRTVAQGYWNSTESGSIFDVTLHDGRGPYVRTGDLGFVHENYLFITGRLKELIIIRGSNYYPEDIESSVSVCHPWLKQEGCVAFGVESSNGEKLVILHELDRLHVDEKTYETVFREIVKTLLVQHELEVEHIVLVKQGSLPKTSSGKKARRECAYLYSSNQLEFIGDYTIAKHSLTRWAGAPTIETGDQSGVWSVQFEKNPDGIRKWISEWLSAKLGIKSMLDGDVETHSLSDYGINSMLAVDLARELSEWLNITIEVTLFWSHGQLNELCNELFSRVKNHLEVEPLNKQADVQQSGQEFLCEPSNEWVIKIRKELALHSKL